jgi:hypothetical protein
MKLQGGSTIARRGVIGCIANWILLGQVHVDNPTVATAIRPDGSTASFSFDYSRSCQAIVPSPPHDISDLLQFTFRDACGGVAGASPLWLGWRRSAAEVDRGVEVRSRKRQKFAASIEAPD